LQDLFRWSQQQPIWACRTPDLPGRPRRQAKTTEVTAKTVEKGSKKTKKLAMKEQPS